MKPSLQSNSSTNRIATALFFFFCVPLSIWETSVQAKIFVPQDAVTTAKNLLVNELIFRASIVSHIFGTIAFLIMALLFYKVFRPVDKHWARFMLIPIIAQVAIVFVLETLNFTALMTLKSEGRAGFDITHQQEAAYFLMRIYRYGIGMDKIIFGLCFIPLGALIFRSGFAPRLVGMLILAGGIGYVADTCFYLLLQRSDYAMVQSIKLASSISYSLGLLWFLIKGVRNPTTVALNN
jgi:hypothetical protein